MKKHFYLFATTLLAVMSVTLMSCGDDNDEPSGGNIVGTWESDLSKFAVEELDEFYEGGEQLMQFRSDGTMTNVTLKIFKDKWVEAMGGKEEFEITHDTWHIDGNKVITSKVGTYEYKVKGNKLTLTPTSGIIIPVTFTRVSDSRIEKYLH